MCADRPDSDVHPVDHPAAKYVLERAEYVNQIVLGRGQISGVLEVAATIMRREAHYCTARYIELMERGMPEETARTLAEDEMGFQLVRTLADQLQPG